jgi:ATP/ADP translocase
VKKTKKREEKKRNGWVFIAFFSSFLFLTTVCVWLCSVLHNISKANKKTPQHRKKKKRTEKSQMEMKRFLLGLY